MVLVVSSSESDDVLLLLSCWEGRVLEDDVDAISSSESRPPAAGNVDNSDEEGEIAHNDVWHEPVVYMVQLCRVFGTFYIVEHYVTVESNI